MFFFFVVVALMLSTHYVIIYEIMRNCAARRRSPTHPCGTFIIIFFAPVCFFFAFFWGTCCGTFNGWFVVVVLATLRELCVWKQMPQQTNRQTDRERETERVSSERWQHSVQRRRSMERGTAGKELLLAGTWAPCASLKIYFEIPMGKQTTHRASHRVIVHCSAQGAGAGGR